MRNREDKKCKKGQESTIGKIIYGFLLFMPLFAIGITCGYAMFNKNAYKSYSASAEIKTFEDINSTLSINKNYYLDTDSSLPTQTLNYIYVYETSPILKNGVQQYAENSIQFFRLYKEGANGLLEIKLNTNTTQYITFNASNKVTFNFNVSANQSVSSEYNTFIHEVVTNVENYIDNVFYYAVDKVTESPLFSWATNSIIYTTTTTTCNALSITTPFIPLLLSYWLIISVIYFLYDIALMLVWIIHRKIHELQESI